MIDHNFRTPSDHVGNMEPLADKPVAIIDNDAYEPGLYLHTVRTMDTVR